MFLIEQEAILDQMEFTEEELYDIDTFKERIKSVINKTDDELTKQYYQDILKFTDEDSFDNYVAKRKKGISIID